MFHYKQFYVCALVGVLIECLYEMHGATIKIVKVCWISKTVIFQLLSMMLINKQKREHSNIRHSIVPCGYDDTGLTGYSSCLFDTLSAYMQHSQCSVSYLWFLLCQQAQ